MNNTSHETFRALMYSNSHARRLINEIAKLDTDLENFNQTNLHPIMMDQMIHRIERLTYQAAQLASEFDGGDTYEHASWLSYNIKRLTTRQIRDPFTGTDLNPFLGARREFNNSTGCLLNTIIIIGLSLIFSSFLFSVFIH